MTPQGRTRRTVPGVLCLETRSSRENSGNTYRCSTRCSICVPSSLCHFPLGLDREGENAWQEHRDREGTPSANKRHLRLKPYQYCGYAIENTWNTRNTLREARWQGRVR